MTVRSYSNASETGSFCLTRTISERNGFAEVPARKVPPAPSEQAHSKTILLVDDQEPVRLYGSAVLEGGGYVPLIADAGAAALEISRNHTGRIDLLLSDLQMPGMSGIQLGREILRHRPNLPIVVMTGCDPDCVHLDEGWHLISKPFTPQQLLGVIADAMARRSMLIQPKPSGRENHDPEVMCAARAVRRAKATGRARYRKLRSRLSRPMPR